MHDKHDFKKADKPFYTGKPGRWDRITVPEMTFLAIDGQGDPSGLTYANALAVLYPVAYALKFAHKAKGADFVVPPLEALWWAEDPAVFLTGERAAWQWTTLIRLPDHTTASELETARALMRGKLTRKGADIAVLSALRLERRQEGDCLQTLHVGPYANEAPTLAHLHDVLMSELGVTFNGPHHEIYLGDPRRVAPEKQRTLLRQPIQPSKTTG